MIVVHFDVLAQPSESLITRQPSVEGRRLWNTFWDRYQGRTILTCDPETPIELLKEWLTKEYYKPSLIQQADEYERSGSTPRADAVWKVQSTLGKVDFYLDTDPDTCSRTIAMGIPTLLVAVPHFIRPEWNREQTLREWTSVVNELETQASRKSMKKWDEL